MSDQTLQPDTTVADRYRLRPGEAQVLLSGHPWRRFVVIGDSTAEGVGDPTDGYPDLGWAEQIGQELARQTPDLVFLNLGERDLRSAEVRQRQLGPALEFGPDLALLACGANDALRPRYDPAAVDQEMEAMITALQATAVDVVTIGLMVMSDYPAFPDWFRKVAPARLRLLAEHTDALAARLGTIHLNLSHHPLGSRPDLLLSRDGLHANARTHAVCAAEVIRRLGAHLGHTPDTV